MSVPRAVLWPCRQIQIFCIRQMPVYDYSLDSLLYQADASYRGLGGNTSLRWTTPVDRHLPKADIACRQTPSYPKGGHSHCWIPAKGRHPLTCGHTSPVGNIWPLIAEQPYRWLLLMSRQISFRLFCESLPEGLLSLSPSSVSLLG